MDLCNRSDIQALLARHGFHFSKSMGQNFLIESWVPAQIADASGADAGVGVLEIGPGIGPLTQQLAQRSGRVVSVELDRRLLPVLAETMAGFDNFTLVEGDAMKMDLRALTAEHFVGLRPILCANLPYNITTPFLTACVQAGCFESLTVLIQKEVAEHFGLDHRPFDLVMHGGSGSTAEEIATAVANGVIKMNVDTDTQYAFTRPVVDHMLRNYDGVLKIDGEVGIKKQYDPRTWGKSAEAGMAARVVEACQRLGADGTQMR